MSIFPSDLHLSLPRNTIGLSPLTAGQVIEELDSLGPYYDIAGLDLRMTSNDTTITLFADSDAVVFFSEFVEVLLEHKPLGSDKNIVVEFDSKKPSVPLLGFIEDASNEDNAENLLPLLVPVLLVED